METLRTHPVVLNGNGFLSFNKKKPSTLQLFNSNGYGSGLGLGLGLRRIGSVRVEAKKKTSKKKQDDDITAPFPEAALLKESTLQEYGKYLPEFANAEEAKLFESLNLQFESQLAVDTMRHYEVVYLVHEKYAADVCNVNQKVQDFIKEKKGKIWRMNDWGMRYLAYRIEDADSANYILMNFELGTEWINEFKDLLDKDERVIRHLVVKRKSAITEASPPPPDFDSLYDDDEDNELYMGNDDEDFDDDEDDLEDEDEDDLEDEDEDAEDDSFEDEDEDEDEDDDFEDEDEDEDEDDDDEADDGDDDAEDAGADSDEEESDDDDDSEQDAKSEVGRVFEDKDGKSNGVAPKTSRRANVKTSSR